MQSHRNKHIDALVNRGDWESLIRYWISFRSRTALDAAAELVSAKARLSREWEPFQEYTRNIAKGFAPPTMPMVPSLSRRELITVEMIPLHLCYLSSLENRWTPEKTAKDIEEGIVAAKKALALSSELTPTDPALSAKCATHVAVGLSRLDCLVEAEAWFKKALNLYDEVAKTNPDECPFIVSQILGTLAHNYGCLGRYQQAIECLESAIKANDHPFITGNQTTVLKDRMHLHDELGGLLLRTHSVPNLPLRKRVFDHFGKACRASEELRSTIGSGGLREEEENRMFSLFARHIENSVEACNQLSSGNPENNAYIIEAVWASEAIRSRQFLDRVVRDSSRVALEPGKTPARSKNPQTPSNVSEASTPQTETDDLDALADKRNPIRIAFNRPKKARSNSDGGSSRDAQM
ncbi:MAG: tetratricopeptide repeat protein, partial [Verrucomicrobiota bacterium]